MKKTIAFTTPKYITSLILPKCALVHGQVLSSVYLQIALNINHQNNRAHPFKEGCWKYQKTIANCTGYNSRVIGPALKALVDLELLSVYQKNKLTIYKLRNHNFNENNIEELYMFNHKIEKKLLEGMNNTDTETFTKLFRELEVINQFNNSFQVSHLLKNIWFDDIFLLREWIKQSESIYKGTSLFFLNNVAKPLFDYIGEENKESIKDIGILSNKERALISGTSPSTISRYIKSFIDVGCLILDEYNTNSSKKLFLNQSFLIDKKNISVVGNNMKMEIKINCPICGSEFKSYKDLGVHIAKTKEAKHIVFKVLKDQKKCKTYEELCQLYNDNKKDIDVDNDNEIDQYLKIPTNCGYSIKCSTCYKNYKKDEIWLNCQEQRKAAYLAEYKIAEKPMVKIASFNKNVEVKKVEENNNDVKVETTDFDVVKSKKTKTIKPDSPAGLVNYFYDRIGRTCLNYKKDTSIVNSALKSNVTPDGIRLTMDFLVDVKKAENLGLFKYCLSESYEYHQFMKDIDKEGTAPYLLKMFYEGIGLPIDHNKFVLEVKKINNLFGTYNYEQLKVAIQYMIAINCPTINFIGNKVGEAIAKMKQNNANKNNPCLYDRDDLHHIKFALRDGKKKIKDIDDRFKDEAIKLAREMYKQGQYADKFSNIEWAWFIGLDLDNEMYKLLKDINCPRLEEIIRSSEVKPELKQKAIRAREVFLNWVNEQISKFEKREVM